MFHRKRKILCACVHCEYILYILLNIYVVQLYAKPGDDAGQLCLLAGGIFWCRPLGLCSGDRHRVPGLGQPTENLWYIFIEGGRTLHSNLPLCKMGIIAPGYCC